MNNLESLKLPIPVIDDFAGSEEIGEGFSAGRLEDRQYFGNGANS